jgi:CheY-like chemotaxis protein
MESVGRLAGGVAHDFNNMLAVIIGHTDMALERVNPAQPLSAELKAIRMAAERSANLTRQLLAFARRQTVAPKVLDLNDTIEGMLAMLRRLIREDIDLVWLPGEGLWPLSVDPSQVDQVLVNLCVNARDAIDGEGRLTIKTANCSFDEEYSGHRPGSARGDHVLLAISDNGCGMDKETLSHLFEPFFTTKEVGKGTGLGLSTVYGIVKQNGGFINVDSEPGLGTTIKIYLPRHQGSGAEAPQEAPAAVRSGHDETILLVEDEPAFLKIGKRMLERVGYRVLAARTPNEALSLAGEHAGEIGLLITDVVMPGMNGQQLAERLQALRPKLRCLFMSGYTEAVIAHHGVLKQGVHFIQKPFSHKDLADKVRQTLDGGEGGA